MFAMTSKHLEKDDDEFLIMAKGNAHKLQLLYADSWNDEVLLEGQLEHLNKHPSDYARMHYSTSPSTNAWVPDYIQMDWRSSYG
jgi:hypothetical protein